jgi:peptidyl-prolyl cis-trans isomerase D
MAIIQRIRNRAGLLVIIIGVALFAFILGDFLTSGSKLYRKQRSNVVVVNGDGVSIEQYQSKINELEEITKMQMGVTTLDEKGTEEVRQRTWQEVTQDMVMEREYGKLGLSVSSDELYDLIGGENPHPYINNFLQIPKRELLTESGCISFLHKLIR